jgi:predicted dehydrogenase/NAD(P)-dependent dehydrogenase (short-subunit alcohol dehydrogenase family)
MAELKDILIIGVGSIGLRHVRCFQSTGRVRLAICETNPDLRQRVAEEFHVAQYADLDAALADKHDAAVIATPAPLHVPIAMRLAEAGMHLLVEKPLSTSLDGIDALRETIAKRGLVAAVAYVYRSHPILRAMREAIASGRFGRPVQVVGVSGQHFPTYRPAYREIYYRDRATGGGAIQDALTHVLNAAEWLVGPVDRVLADAEHKVLEGVEVEDTVNVLTRHGEVMGCYSLNQHQAPNELTLTVICEHGTARFEPHRQRWRWMTEPGDDWHDESTPPLPRDAMFINQANGFLDAIEGRAPAPCSLEEGLQTLRVNLAALASSEAKTWQTIGPERVERPKRNGGVGIVQNRKRSARELFDLTGRVALVSGGTGLYGRQIAEALAEAGARTFIASRNLGKLRTQAGVFQKAGLDVTALQYDQAQEKSIQELLRQVLEAAGRIDILVNNSVLRPMRDWSDPAADFARSMEVNATGLFVMTRTFGDQMARQGAGSIINVGSIQGVVGPDFTLYEGLPWNTPPDYFFHKGGLVQLTRYAAAKLAPHGVRVNAVSPGGFFSNQDDRFVERYKARTFVGRMANETDLKGAIVFLASDASAYVTGANLAVDGGYTCK